MSFKDKLKEKRLEANLTQVQLAEKVSSTMSLALANRQSSILWKSWRKR